MQEQQLALVQEQQLALVQEQQLALVQEQQLALVQDQQLRQPQSLFQQAQCHLRRLESQSEFQKSVMALLYLPCQ